MSQYDVTKFVGDSRYEQIRAHLSYSWLCADDFLSQRNLCSFVFYSFFSIFPPLSLSLSRSLLYSVYFPISVKAVLAHFTSWETLHVLPLRMLAWCSCLCVSTHTLETPLWQNKNNVMEVHVIKHKAQFIRGKVFQTLTTLCQTHISDILSEHLFCGKRQEEEERNTLKDNTRNHSALTGALHSRSLPSRNKDPGKRCELRASKESETRPQLCLYGVSGRFSW